MSSVQVSDIAELVERHERWRAKCWNLIASENVTSHAVRALTSSDLSHRYGDYEGIDLRARKYCGNRFILEVEQRGHDLARALFGAQYVDLRPLSGHVAGIAPLLALCRPGDTVLELSRECGGHRLAAKMAYCRLVELRVVPIPFDVERLNIDVDATMTLIEREKPRLVILGSSCFLFPAPVAALRVGIDALDSDTVLQYDASHVLGLIAGGRFQCPLAEGAHLVTSSTHKTLGGPQGGLILTNSEVIAEAVGNAMRSLVANHHLHRLPALCAAFAEWAECGAAAVDKIVESARGLGAALEAQGVSVVGSHLRYTASHTILLRTKELGPASELARQLENANIIVSVCCLPDPLGPEGIRLGTQEMVRRGMVAGDTDEVAAVIAAVLQQRIDGAAARKRVGELARKMSERVAGPAS